MTPDAYTIKEFFIEVGGGHQLYVYEWGNPKGMPIIFLHGGPGSHVKDKHKSAFDPTRHRVIFFDQRGCGKSLPFGSIEHNTTADMMEDISKIADQVKLKQFTLFGGSWGAFLALVYAVKHPKRVKALTIDGVFTGTQKEIDYFDRGEFRLHFPDVWERYLNTVPKSHQNSPTKYHFKRILGTDEKAVRESACAYQNLEGALLSLDDRFQPSSPDDPTFDPSSVKLEVHYLYNSCFVPDNYILNNAHKLTMPVWMIQGRYDMVCPPIAAYELHKKLPNSQLILTTSNHLPEHETHNVRRAILLQLTEKA